LLFSTVNFAFVLGWKKEANMIAKNWKGLKKEANQPILVYLKDNFRFIFPEIPKWRSSGLVGGYNPISIGGGHEFGLSADIYVRVSNPTEKMIGDGLFEMFMWNSNELGIEHIIWNKLKWEAKENIPGVPRKYQGKNPHTDHIHIRFTREMSQRMPPILIFKLKELHDELFGSYLKT